MKILIINANMTTGGLETSLLNFIHQLKADHEIDLFLLNHQGKLMQALPNDICVLPEEKTLKKFGQIRTNVQRNFVKRVVVKTLKAVGVKDWLISRDIKSLNDMQIEPFVKDYDLAINFNAYNHICNELLINNVCAKHKMAIVHNDVYVLPFSKLIVRQLSKIDYCLGCSKSCAQHIWQKYPKLSNVDYLYNFQDTQKFIDLADQECDINPKKRYKFVCVGRLAKQKSPMRLLKVVNKLNREFENFDIYFLGEGELYDSAKQYVAKHKLENVHLLGNQSNPYKFIKKADMLILASRFEAAPMVYAEAMTLGVPVLTTRTCSADELVGNLGLVCDNNRKAIHSAIKSVLNGSFNLEQKKQNLKDYRWDNQAIKQKLYILTKDK